MENISVGQGVQATSSSYNNVEIKPVTAKENIIEVKNQKLKDDNVDPIVEKNVEELNEFLESYNTEAIISNHEVFGDTMIKIVNKSTKEVLLEIPPQKLLDMVAKLCEIVGLKLDKKV